MASAIMSGTVIYYDALRELALENTLDKLSTAEKDILVKADRGPTSHEEYEKVFRTVTAQVDRQVDWFLRDRMRAGKSATFYLTAPGGEQVAGSDNARSYFAFVPRLTDHITLLPGGRMPQEQALNDPGQPLALEGIIPAEAARLFGLEVGDRLSTIPYWEDAIPYASVVVSGIFERNDAEEEIWHLDDTILKAATSGNFKTVPVFISETTFMEELGGAFRDLDSTYVWLLSVDEGKLNADNTSNARIGITDMGRRLGANLFSYRQITSLDDALEEYDERLFFSKLPMFIILILIAVVILYYVVTLSSLVVEQQRAEIALLRSRGATSAQVLAVFVLEGATIAIIAVVVAPLLAATIISLLGLTPAFSGLSGTGLLNVNISRGAYLMSALGGLLSFAALMIPAVQASRIEVVRHRQQASRPSAEPFFQRFYLDVMLLVVSIFLFRQLTEQGSVVATGVFGEVAESHLSLAVPALVLVATAMVLLRLFPLAIRFLSGDSPVLLHLVAAGAIGMLAPSIAVNSGFEGNGPSWLAQEAFLLALAGAYWATYRSQRTDLKLGGMALQGALVASILYIGPDLPLSRVFAPLLIAIVPAQVVFIFLRTFALRAPVGFTLGLWQMARNPTHYARLSLLLILMAGLGIFAASFGGTLNRSFEERALYASGAEIRLEGLILNSSGSSRPLVESYKEIAGVKEATPAVRGWGTDLSRLLGTSYLMLAVDKDVFPDIAWFRDDFADRSVPGLLRSLGSPDLPQGIELPIDARTVGVVVKADRPHQGIVIAARMRDSNDRYFTHYLGVLRSIEWLRLETPLDRPGRFGRNRLRPTPPLTLVSLSIHETNSLGRLRAGSVIIDEINVTTLAGGLQVIESFDDLDAWNVLRTVPEAASDSLQGTSNPELGLGGGATFIWSDGTPLTSRGIYHGPLLPPLPVLANKEFIEESDHSLGDVFNVSVRGHRVPVQLVDTVDYFPTLDTINESYLIADLPSLSRYANLEAVASELRPNEMWISTETNGNGRDHLLSLLQENEPFPVNTVHDRVQFLADSQVDPLVEAGWRALLFMAFAAILILSGLGFLVHAYVAFRSREVQFALMRTIGFSKRQLIVLVWLEQALVIVAGMALGTWMGGRLGAIVMPYLGHDDQGSQVLPPFVMEINWSALLTTYAAMAFIFALITWGLVWFIQRISLQRILRLGEM